MREGPRTVPRGGGLLSGGGRFLGRRLLAPAGRFVGGLARRRPELLPDVGAHLRVEDVARPRDTGPLHSFRRLRTAGFVFLALVAHARTFTFSSTPRASSTSTATEK